MHRPRAALDAQAPQHLGATMLALREVLGLLFEAEAGYGEPRFRRADAPIEAELAVAVGFHGDVEGWLALGMRRETAIALANTIAHGEEAPLATPSGDSLREVANIMASACAMTMHRRGFRLTVGEPIVAIDEPLTVDWSTLLVLEVPIRLPQGTIDAALSMRVRGAVPPAAALGIQRIELDF